MVAPEDAHDHVTISSSRRRSHRRRALRIRPFQLQQRHEDLNLQKAAFWAARIEGVRGEKNYTALVLEAIASGRGEIVSYDHLCMEVFGNVSPATKVRLGSVVARIRARLDKMHHLGGNYLVTCHGVGYMLATDGNQHRR